MQVSLVYFFTTFLSFSLFFDCMEITCRSSCSQILRRCLSDSRVQPCACSFGLFLNSRTQPAEFTREQNQDSGNDSSLVGSKESSDAANVRGGTTQVLRPPRCHPPGPVGMPIRNNGNAPFFPPLSETWGWVFKVQRLLSHAPRAVRRTMISIEQKKAGWTPGPLPTEHPGMAESGSFCRRLGAV